MVYGNLSLVYYGHYALQSVRASIKWLPTPERGDTERFPDVVVVQARF